MTWGVGTGTEAVERAFASNLPNLGEEGKAAPQMAGCPGDRSSRGWLAPRNQLQVARAKA